MLTMSEVKLNQHFKARKWYYVSKNKMAAPSFVRLKTNIENQKLGYKIDNYQRKRRARITPLIIGAVILGVIGTVGGG